MTNWPTIPSNSPDEEAHQQAVELLTSQWRSGLLSREEFAARLHQVLGEPSIDPPAQTRSTGVEPLVHDGEVVDSWTSDEPDALPTKWAPEGTPGQGVSVSIMGGTTVADRWTIAESHLSVAVMGGNELDLREASFTAPVTTITVIAVMGGVEVIVPPELDVEVRGIGVMGGFGWAAKNAVSPTGIDHQGPKVVIRGVALMGGAEVVRKERTTH